MTTYFISDIHLEAERSDICERFISFFRQQAPAADAIYILGDLFGYWIGDDDQQPWQTPIKLALQQASKQTAIYLMHGNRDFLLGKRLLQETGCQLLADPHLISLYGTPTLLMHGDSLCTLDAHYQAYRNKVRQTWLQQLFLWLPLRVRRSIANKLRRPADTNRQIADDPKYDVVEAEACHLLQQFDSQRLIHGHTHKPAIHEMRLYDSRYQRIVLGAWEQSAEILRYKPDQSFEMISVMEVLDSHSK